MIPQWWWLLGVTGVLVALSLGCRAATRTRTVQQPPQRTAPLVPPTLTWDEQTLALREELEACSPELRDAPFLYALANEDFAVHLRWEVDDDPFGTEPRAWARVALFRRRPEGYHRLVENGARGVGNERTEEHLVAALHDWANEQLPPALTHAAGYVPIAERDGVGALPPLPTDLYVTAGLEPASVAPLVAEVGPLPADYVATVERWGDPMVNGFVRVHSPTRALERFRRGRDDAGRFFFWDANADLLDRKDFADTVELADTFDGDMFLVHPANPGWVFFAPRDGETVERFAGLWSAIESVVRRRGREEHHAVHASASGSRHGGLARRRGQGGAARSRRVRVLRAARRPQRPGAAERCSRAERLHGRLARAGERVRHKRPAGALDSLARVRTRCRVAGPILGRLEPLREPTRARSPRSRPVY